MEARDTLHAKHVRPKCGPRSESLLTEKLENHMATQLMKVVATLSASNATKCDRKGATATSERNRPEAPSLTQKPAKRACMAPEGWFGTHVQCHLGRNI